MGKRFCGWSVACSLHVESLSLGHRDGDVAAEQHPKHRRHGHRVEPHSAVGYRKRRRRGTLSLVSPFVPFPFPFLSLFRLLALAAACLTTVRFVVGVVQGDVTSTFDMETNTLVFTAPAAVASGSEVRSHSTALLTLGVCRRLG